MDYLDRMETNLACHSTYPHARTPGMSVVQRAGCVIANSGLPCGTFNTVFSAEACGFPRNSSTRLLGTFEHDSGPLSGGWGRPPSIQDSRRKWKPQDFVMPKQRRG